MTDNRVVIDISRDGFADAVLSALEKDTGAVPIVPEIIRILKIKQRREQIAAQRLANLAKANLARRTPGPVEIQRQTLWQRIKLIFQ